MIVRIIGEMGRSMMDMVVRMATTMLVGLLVRHCFMWFVVCGGSVTAVQYASRK